jgi:hypothetical protein
MNIKCSFCQTPYTLSRVEMLDALQEMEASKLNHHDAHCPRCRRATRVERKRMELFFPNWRDALKQFEADMKAHPQQEASTSSSAPEAAPVKQAESGPEAMPAKAQIKGDTKVKPPSKQQVGQHPAARSERGRKPPAKNTPSQGKKRNR